VADRTFGAGSSEPGVAKRHGHARRAGSGLRHHPLADVTYALLSSGLMEDSYSVERHLRLGDLVHAALL